MIYLDLSNHSPLYEQIKQQLKKLIISGALCENQQMPSVRELAQSLAINPNTIQRAYRDLEAEGYINSIRGKGNFVASVNVKMGEKRADELFPKFKEAVKELKYIGVNKERLFDMIEIMYGEEADKK